MHHRAVTHLKQSDPVLARIIARVGACRLEIRAEGTHFDALVRSIVFQQLSTRAATTIYGRVRALFGDRSPSAADLLATGADTLRSAGLSWAKIKYVKDLSTRAVEGSLDVERLHELEDSAIIEALVQVKGIGRWTAHMFLIFRLGRPDIVPELDLGVRTAIQRAYGLRKLPTPAKVLTVGKAWAPYGSVAAWYLWRSLELAAPQAPVGAPAKVSSKRR